MSLFLSANEPDILEAVEQGLPAGRVLESSFTDDPEDRSLRIAFDFDGVLADDQSETIYRAEGLKGGPPAVFMGVLAVPGTGRRG